MRLLAKEWDYLTPEAKRLTAKYMQLGVKDLELAVELAIQELGDAVAFDLEVGEPHDE